MKGYIRKRGRNSWALTYDGPRGPDGRRNQKYATVRGSRADAEARLSGLIELSQAKPATVELSDAMIYAIRAADAIKIGIAQNLERRIANLQVGNPFPLTLLWTVGPLERGKALGWEHSIHAHFQRDRLEGEWFKYSESLASLPDMWQFLADTKDCQDEDRAAADLLEGFIQAKLKAAPAEQASYTPDEAAIALGIDGPEVAALIESGAIPIVRMSTQGVRAARDASPVRIRHKDLVAYRDSA